MNQNYRNILNNLTSITNESIFNDTQNSEYHSLFMGVIFRALLDATKPVSTNEPTHIKVDRRAAKAWFYACSGVTCENFEYICDVAGVDPVAMRTIADKIFSEEDTSYARKQINSFFYET